MRADVFPAAALTVRGVNTAFRDVTGAAPTGPPSLSLRAAGCTRTRGQGCQTVARPSDSLRRGTAGLATPADAALGQ